MVESETLPGNHSIRRRVETIRRLLRKIKKSGCINTHVKFLRGQNVSCLRINTRNGIHRVEVVSGIRDKIIVSGEKPDNENADFYSGTFTDPFDTWCNDWWCDGTE